ncbi:hypothetical protein J3Q64DRAFT_1833315 [Phycomyces blakesleeanus]|uniref:C2H2-type domain-containing protein n=1 Tax=Phycomyces blakesleeanus TaxID=4837 RepID=A0ABR3B6B6_PHYBL
MPKAPRQKRTIVNCPPPKRPGEINFSLWERDLTCPVCSKTFLQTWSLRRHLTGVHQKSNPEKAVEYKAVKASDYSSKNEKALITS